MLYWVYEPVRGTYEGSVTIHMKHKNGWISLTIALLLALSCLLGSAAVAEVSAQELTPATGAVKMLVNVTGGKDDAEMVLFAEALSKATGLEISMEKPPSDYTQIQRTGR